jgi:DNA helicase-2/ATP-dependent DNA helicase PcrA
MNARVPTLAQTVSVSFSDAHSPDRIGREATVFSGELSWAGLRRAIENQSVAMTIEVFPEHGKYHLDGHRACGVRCLPAESNQRGGRCPVCGRPLTHGVLGRVEVLSSTGEPEGVPRPFAKTLPLDEIVSVVAGKGPRTRTVQRTVEHLWQVAPELDLLLETPLDAIETEAGVELARALGAVRRGEVEVEPGYDGVYGRLMVPNP